mmetsp:Transcript_6678/g.7661  ORF Transcript_6678/g.7661 Transcript_6678/m.7661 type:complete len:370 (+) Transcript_6678:120-1229(+)
MAANGKRSAEEAGLDQSTSNARVVGFRPLLPPAILLEELPISKTASATVLDARDIVSKILTKEDDRLVCIVGPCSIHSEKSAMEYAEKLKAMADQYKNDLLVIMRVYFEKPRTTVGWKGLINDPELNGSFQINKGLRVARKLLLDINNLGLPAGTEFLDSISPQFTSDLVSWGAIGARTTESQIHRELASGLSCPIGFKNGTGGNMQVAVDAIQSASNEHNFLGVTDQGLAAIVKTKGNANCHIILRGGHSGTNFDAKSVGECKAKLEGKKMNTGIMIDCSHGNSNKKHENQIKVIESVAEQVAAGERHISGVMVESNIKEGNQKLSVGVTDPATLEYGKSVTDACVNLETTATMLKMLSEAVQKRRTL